MTKAIDDIAAERQRQIEVEGWTPEHDDTHDDSELADAAACYAMMSRPGNPDVMRDILARLWPWNRSWWKPKTRRADLVRAGALIVAEIERLDRDKSAFVSTKGFNPSRDDSEDCEIPPGPHAWRPLISNPRIERCIFCCRNRMVRETNDRA